VNARWPAVDSLVRGILNKRDQQLNGGCERVCEWRGMMLSSQVRSCDDDDDDDDDDEDVDDDDEVFDDDDDHDK
jgi:hypothetical protein